MLGILAAGAAQGAANASNMNVQAQNQVEMQSMQHGRDLERDALREEFLNKRFDKEVAIKREDAKAAGALRDREYERNLADSRVDTESQRGFQREILGVTEGNKLKMHNDRMGLLKSKLDASSAKSGEAVRKAQSPIGKEAQDYMDMGLADNDHDAFRMAARSRAGEIVMANPMNMTKEPAELVALVNDYAAKLYPKMNEGGGVGVEPAADTVDYMVDPNTGQLVNKRATQSQPKQQGEQRNTRPTIKGAPVYEDVIPRDIPMNVIGDHGLQRKNVNPKTGASLDHKSGYLLLNKIDPKTGKMLTIKVDPITGDIVESL